MGVSCCCVCLLGHRMENFHCDWGDKGGNAGACWECWKCEPCCGEPCGVVPAIKCILCFWCCNPCSMGKLFSHTLEQDCAVVNHCLYACFCYEFMLEPQADLEFDVAEESKFKETICGESNLRGFLHSRSKNL